MTKPTDPIPGADPDKKPIEVVYGRGAHVLPTGATLCVQPDREHEEWFAELEELLMGTREDETK